MQLLGKIKKIMTRRLDKFSVRALLMLLLSSFPAFSSAEDNITVLFQSGDEAVYYNPSDKTEDILPLDLSDIVQMFYQEQEEAPDSSISVALGVLTFLADVYKDHSFHESGSWCQEKSNFSYIPYQGDLPEYETGDFKLPVKGLLTSGYGYRPKFRRFHHGIDFALNSGDTVNCTLPGVVTRTGYDSGGYGRFVVVSHSGGVETLYAHLLMSVVNPGQKLNAGDPVGLGGSTGNATGSHLHFETRYRGVPMDPVAWFNLHPEL